VLDLIATGKLRALAVTGPHRIPALPDVPTVGEAGYPDLVIQDWFGIIVRRGTPDEIVTRLNAAVNDALGTPEVRAAITRLSAEPVAGTPAAFGSLVAAQIAHWGQVVKDSGMAMHR
jgi:tripartite-type tricarboxylate transporter receptor subunit TctC